MSVIIAGMVCAGPVCPWTADAFVYVTFGRVDALFAHWPLTPWPLRVCVAFQVTTGPACDHKRQNPGRTLHMPEPGCVRPFTIDLWCSVYVLDMQACGVYELLKLHNMPAC